MYQGAAYIHHIFNKSICNRKEIFEMTQNVYVINKIFCFTGILKITVIELERERISYTTKTQEIGLIAIQAQV